MLEKNKFYKIVSEHEVTYYDKICFTTEYYLFNHSDQSKEQLNNIHSMSALYSPLCLSIVFGELKLIEFLYCDLKKIASN